VVPVGSPVNSAAEFIDYGKKKQGGIFYGSPGLGTPSQMLAVKIAATKQMTVEHVHYRGGAPMMADLITGRVDFGLTSYTLSRAYIADGKLKALAIDAPNRLPELPNVPTFDEVGLGDARVASWFALAAPAGTPAEVVRVLHAEFVKASKNPELRQRLAQNGTPITVTTPDEMRKLLAEEVANTEQLVKQLSLRPKE
jgi:tripartite-type tricarboxylate transporter receptor subunit TctC